MSNSIYSDVLPKIEEHLAAAQSNVVGCQENLLKYAHCIELNRDVCNSNVLRLLCAHFIDALDKYQALLSERDTISELVKVLS